jgi:hypothetical protein
MSFLKEHLTGNYNWVDAAPHTFPGDPSRRVFDPSNGNQILGIINFFGRSIGKLTTQDGQKLEKLILDELPPNAKSEIAVFNWLRENYMYY